MLLVPGHFRTKLFVPVSHLWLFRLHVRSQCFLFFHTLNCFLWRLNTLTRQWVSFFWKSNAIFFHLKRNWFLECCGSKHWQGTESWLLAGDQHWNSGHQHEIFSCAGDQLVTISDPVYISVLLYITPLCAIMHKKQTKFRFNLMHQSIPAAPMLPTPTG